MEKEKAKWLPRRSWLARLRRLRCTLCESDDASGAYEEKGHRLHRRVGATHTSLKAIIGLLAVFPAFLCFMIIVLGDASKEAARSEDDQASGGLGVVNAVTSEISHRLFFTQGKHLEHQVVGGSREEREARELAMTQPRKPGEVWRALLTRYRQGDDVYPRSRAENGTRLDRSEKCSDSGDCEIRRGCVRTELGVCYDAPFRPHGDFKYEPNLTGGRIAPTGGTSKEELRCSWMGNIPPQELPSFDLKPKTSPPNVVNAFKHITGSFFQNWYDWDAPIKEVPEDDPFEMSAEHETQHHHYKIKNFCVRASGNLTGWSRGGNPETNMSRFLGGNDVHPFVRESYSEFDSLVTEYFQSPEPLEKKPEWYIDRKIAIMPMMGWHALHEGHALQRTGAFLSNIEDAWPLKKQPGETANQNPDFARNDVTAMYVNIYIPPGRRPAPINPEYYPPYCRENCSWLDYGFRYHTTMATTSHFTTFNRAEDGFNVFARKTKSGSKDYPMGSTNLQHFKHMMGNTSICFREAVVFQACFLPQCSSVEDSGSHAWPLFGRRHPDVQRRVARRFRACAAVEHLDQSHSSQYNLEAPTVLYSYRSRTKSVQNDASIVPVMHKRLFQLVPKAKFLMYEMSELSVGSLVALYSTVDIVIATYGSAFLYGFLMPQANVGVEIAFKWMTISQWNGIDRQGYSDYGGMFRANRGHHIVLDFSENFGRAPYRRVMMPPSVVTDMVDSAICTFQYTRNAPIRHRRQILNTRYGNEGLAAGTLSFAIPITGLRKTCEMGLTEILPHETKLITDHYGSDLRRSIRATLPKKLVGYAPRLLMLADHSHLMAKVFSWMKTESVNAAALIFQCPSFINTTDRHAHPESPKDQVILHRFVDVVLTELKWARGYVSRRNWVSVFFNEGCHMSFIQKLNTSIYHTYTKDHGKDDMGGFTDDGGVRLCGRLYAGRSYPRDIEHAKPPKRSGEVEYKVRRRKHRKKGDTYDDKYARDPNPEDALSNYDELCYTTTFDVVLADFEALHYPSVAKREAIRSFLWHRLPEYEEQRGFSLVVFNHFKSYSNTRVGSTAARTASSSLVNPEGVPHISMMHVDSIYLPLIEDATKADKWEKLKIQSMYPHRPAGDHTLEEKDRLLF